MINQGILFSSRVPYFLCYDTSEVSIRFLLALSKKQKYYDPGKTFWFFLFYGRFVFDRSRVRCSKSKNKKA